MTPAAPFALQDISFSHEFGGASFNLVATRLVQLRHLVVKGRASRQPHVRAAADILPRGRALLHAILAASA
jgi:hypothetical protein